MIYEIRTYQIAAGQMANELRRMARLALGGEADAMGKVPGYERSLMAACGVPPMLGVWSSSAGAGSEQFFYLCRYEDIDLRDEAWSKFWNHPDLARVIAETTSGTAQVVEWTFPILMRPGAAWEMIRGRYPGARQIGQLHELRFDQIAFGEAGRAHEILGKYDFPILRRHGAEILGCFDVWMGPNIPTVVTILAWPDLVARGHALHALDRDSEALAVRRLHHDEAHGAVFRRTRVHLLDPAPFCTPAANFGDEA